MQKYLSYNALRDDSAMIEVYHSSEDIHVHIQKPVSIEFDLRTLKLQMMHIRLFIRGENYFIAFLCLYNGIEWARLLIR